MIIRVQRIGGERVEAARDFDKDVVRIGRESSNDLVLADEGAERVSRHHAELRATAGGWRLVDLGSANGTYLRGQRVSEASLADGDEIQFAPNGPRLRVTLLTARDTTTSGSAAVTAKLAAPTDSELLPLHMGLDPIAQKGYLAPGLVVAGTITAFLVTFKSVPLQYSLAIVFFFFAAMTSVALYLLCGKRKPLLPLIASALAVGVIVAYGHTTVVTPLKALVLPYIAKQTPGKQPDTVVLSKPDTVPGQLVYYFFMAAVPEELEKITPALFGLYLYRRYQRRGMGSPLSAQFEVREPLDGIVLGIVGGAAFNFVEAVGYASIPVLQLRALQEQAVPLAQKYGVPALLEIGFNSGLSVLFQVFFRGVGDVFGHQAYAGIFGYYVGLAAMRPDHTRALLLRGFATATIVHAFWNATVDVGGVYVLPSLAFALLITCIIKARETSPTRDSNFATTLGAVS